MADSYRICSGASGLGANYIAYLQRPTWRPSEHICTDGDLDVLVTTPKRRTCTVCHKAYEPTRDSTGLRCPACRSAARIAAQDRLCASLQAANRRQKARQRAAARQAREVVV